MTSLSPSSPFTVGTKVAFVEYHSGIPSIRSAVVAKVTPSGRFQVRYPHMKEGEMSDRVYQPEVEVVEYQNYTKGWRGNPRGQNARYWESCRLWDEEVEKLVEKRKRYERTSRLLNEVQQRVSSMRATWENAEELVEKLAAVLGIEVPEEGKE